MSKQKTANDSLILKLQQAQALIDDCLINLKGKTTSGQAQSRKRAAKTTEKASEEVSLIAIVNKIKDCDESEKIEKKVLDKQSVDNRILLVFYACSQHFPQRRLTSGEISKVTSELGVKISQPNVAKKITRSLLKYLDSDSTRVRGKASFYKLNRKGISYFESVIDA